MAEPNVRIFVTGQPKADAEFDRFNAARERAQKEIERLNRDLERVAARQRARARRSR